ncbi:MAG: PEF-CTERM sorting domain-containing protein, partial [Methanosarcina sp.]
VSVRAGTDRFNVVITRTDVPGGVIHLSANPLYQDLVFPTKGARVISTTPIVLTMSGAEEGETYDVTVSGTTLKVQATAEVASVPEFPTVALPVAAMLGLLFVFGRKKEGL